MQPALRNCQQETLECWMLLLNSAVTEAEQQESPIHEARCWVSKGREHCATGILHPIRNSTLRLEGREAKTFKPCHHKDHNLSLQGEVWI